MGLLSKFKDFPNKLDRGKPSTHIRPLCFRKLLWALIVTIAVLIYTISLVLFSSSRCELPKRTTVGNAHPFLPRDLIEGRLMHTPWEGDLREMGGAWNRLCFGRPAHKLRIALFVKKWPVGGLPGGLERHALTLHRALANRGHDVHVYTVGDGTTPDHMENGGLTVHFFKSTPHGGFNYTKAWDAFLLHNSSLPFDIVHTESVALPHWKAREFPNLAASWHGISYECVHSDIVQDLVRKPGLPRSSELQRAFTERLIRITEEIRFFSSYRHHVGTSDYVSDVLRTIYEIPAENVHTILNGVDELKFMPDPAKGAAFRAKHGVPQNASLVFGAAGRLVQDKGHPLLFEAFSEILKKNKDVYLLVAGIGPWGDRYKELAPNAVMVGTLLPEQLAEFYNAMDVFVNPTLRAQGLDHTLLEAMQCGKPVLATRFSSITWSVIVSEDLGYTFSPNVPSLIRALEVVISDSKAIIKSKGQACHRYASLMFTAATMASSYERLFVCIKDQSYCHYPLPMDCPVQPNPYV